MAQQNAQCEREQNHNDVEPYVAHIPHLSIMERKMAIKTPTKYNCIYIPIEQKKKEREKKKM